MVYKYGQRNEHCLPRQRPANLAASPAHPPPTTTTRLVSVADADTAALAVMRLWTAKPPRVSVDACKEAVLHLSCRCLCPELEDVRRSHMSVHATAGANSFVHLDGRRVVCIAQISFLVYDSLWRKLALASRWVIFYRAATTARQSPTSKPPVSSPNNNFAINVRCSISTSTQFLSAGDFCGWV